MVRVDAADLSGRLQVEIMLRVDAAWLLSFRWHVAFVVSFLGFN
jgi:hypothetical protein